MKERGYKRMPPAGALRLRDGRGAVRECRPELGERRGAPIPTTFDPGRAEQSRPRASRSFVQWRAPP